MDPAARGVFLHGLGDFPTLESSTQTLIIFSVLLPRLFFPQPQQFFPVFSVFAGTWALFNFLLIVNRLNMLQGGAGEDEK